MTLYEGMLLNEQYEVLRPLGEGGMGATYLVEDTQLGRQCVIKEVLSHDTTSREQFKREASLLANLRHPNLPVVYHYFFHNDHPYIVMQFVKGTTLDRLREGRSAPFEPHDVLNWGKDLLDALQYMHGQDPPVIHRDIKPQNVCITPEANAVLLDFGIARQLDKPRTSTAAQRLTQGYAPVEQYPEEELAHAPPVRRYVEELRSEGIRTGSYTDVYGVGATLYFALTLMKPMDACMRVLEDELKPIEDTNPEAPEFLIDVVMKALSIDPRERFQTADDMLAALRPEVEEAPQQRLRYRPPRSLPTQDVEVLGQALVYIAEGKFLMGSNDPRLKDACHPQHTVELGSYCIARSPVTNADYQRFIDNNPDYPVPHNPMRYAQRYNWDQEARTYPRGLEDHPVVLVTWQDARAYCRWLTEVTGYQCRLPSEAEWEKAARWDADAERALRYPWGDEFDEEKCNVDAHGELRLESSQVGQYLPAGDSPYGLADMAGNVWEWTSSFYQPYPYRGDDGREEPDEGGIRVVRGGAYDQASLMACSAWREAVQPDVSSASIGFRPACEAE